MATGALASVFLQIIQVQNNHNTMGETVGFLQDIVQVKVNNVVYIINVTWYDKYGKQVNTVLSEVATTIWDKLSA